MASNDPTAARRRAACIDIGSNGIRCVAVESDGTHATTLLQERAPVRLGESVFAVGTIDARTMDAALAALRGFRTSLDKLGPMPVRTVATSAIRDARNRSAFITRAHEFGVQVEVISGTEEARLVHVAVHTRIPMGTTPWLLVDVGGGSVEISLANAECLLWTESRRIGAVRLLEQLREVAGDPTLARRIIEGAVGSLRVPGINAGKLGGLAAIGGNIEELAGICGTMDPQTKVGSLSVKALSSTLDAMQALGTKERAEKWNLTADRADVIVPAGLIYEQVARLAGVDLITVPHVSLKDGVLAELFAGAALGAAPPAHRAAAGRVDAPSARSGLQLTLVRHAEAHDRGPTGDASRELTSPGKLHAAATGHTMARNGVQPDRIVASPAARTWQTAVLAAHELGIETDRVVKEVRIYDADLATLVEVVAAHGKGCRSLLLVGHNPGISLLATHVAGHSWPMHRGSAATFEIPAWDRLEPGCGAPGRAVHR